MDTLKFPGGSIFYNQHSSTTAIVVTTQVIDKTYQLKEFENTIARPQAVGMTFVSFLSF